MEGSNQTDALVHRESKGLFSNHKPSQTIGKQIIQIDKSGSGKDHTSAFLMQVFPSQRFRNKFGMTR